MIFSIFFLVTSSYLYGLRLIIVSVLRIILHWTFGIRPMSYLCMEKIEWNLESIVANFSFSESERSGEIVYGGKLWSFLSVKGWYYSN